MGIFNCAICTQSCTNQKQSCIPVLWFFSPKKCAWDSVHSWDKWKRSHSLELQQTVTYKFIFYQHKLFILCTWSWNLIDTLPQLAWGGTLYCLESVIFMVNFSGAKISPWAVLLVCFPPSPRAALHRDPGTSGINTGRQKHTTHTLPCFLL